MKDIIRKSLPATIAATLTAGVVAIPALAATTDEETDAANEDGTEETEESDGDRRHGFGLARGLEEGELAERLAAELDLETDTVQSAIDAVRGDLAGERLATQVEEGRLTQEQADRIAAALADGDREAAREVFDEVRLAALTERLAEKVEAGELTQEEADELLARAEDGDFPGRPGRRGGHSRSGDASRGPADATNDATDGVELEGTSV